MLVGVQGGKRDKSKRRLPHLVAMAANFYPDSGFPGGYAGCVPSGIVIPFFNPDYLGPKLGGQNRSEERNRASPDEAPIRRFFRAV